MGRRALGRGGQPFRAFGEAVNGAFSEVCEEGEEIVDGRKDKKIRGEIRVFLEIGEE